MKSKLLCESPFEKGKKCGVESAQICKQIHTQQLSQGQEAAILLQAFPYRRLRARTKHFHCIPCVWLQMEGREREELKRRLQLLKRPRCPRLGRCSSAAGFKPPVGPLSAAAWGKKWSLSLCAT